MNKGDSALSALSAVSRPVCPVEPISAFYGQDGQEALVWVGIAAERKLHAKWDAGRQRLRRGVFHSIAELIDAIEKYIADHNRHPKPFVWTAKACDILEKVTRARRTLDMVQSK